ncbi:MAG: SO_0444 family Cu/Zn efflux transporter [Nitrospinota bacterium]|nr:SO_0444 family Cu/Zn efflux transporter [Nitrospinota bacterium]MDH5755149.1 SO_0444 family Cu/Zn efflux transporter [Nitrospinota bacterium]
MSFVFDTLSTSWEILQDSAIFLLVGFLLAGVVKVYLPIDLIKRKLGGDGFRSVLNAALVGIPLPLCSCSVIPTAVSLRSNGASKGATSAFLISTPESGADSIAITYALLDPVMTIFRPVAAFFTALLAGVMENLLGDRQEAPMSNLDKGCKDDCCGDDCDVADGAKKADKAPRSNLNATFHFAFVEMMDDLAGYLLFGILAAGMTGALIPDGFFAQYTGDGFVAMLVMLVAGIPMYICATASTPLAAALMLKGLSPGAALVFLLSGPATNIGTLVIIRKFLGGRSMAIYLAAIAVGALSAGMALNMLYAALDIDPAATIGQATRIFPPQAELIAALIFSALAIRSLAAWLFGGIFPHPKSKTA